MFWAKSLKSLSVVRTDILFRSVTVQIKKSVLEPCTRFDRLML